MEFAPAEHRLRGLFLFLKSSASSCIMHWGRSELERETYGKRHSTYRLTRCAALGALIFFGATVLPRAIPDVRAAASVASVSFVLNALTR